VRSGNIDCFRDLLVSESKSFSFAKNTALSTELLQLDEQLALL